MWREIAPCTSQKYLNIKQKETIQEGTIYRGLEVLQISLRGLYIIVGVDCGVWHLEDNYDKVQYWPKYFCLR